MKYLKTFEYYDENYSNIENIGIIEEIISLVDEFPELRWETDCPLIPIGGGNPYYKCKYCGKTNVQISIDNGKHYNQCEWVEAKHKYDLLLSQLNIFEKENLEDIIDEIKY